MAGVYPLLQRISKIKGDIRYYLCSLDHIYKGTDRVDLSSEDSMNKITQTFLNCMRFNEPKTNSFQYLLSSPTPSEMMASHKQINTAPIAADLFDQFDGQMAQFEKSQSVYDRISPLLQFHKEKSTDIPRYERYSTMAAKEEDAFDFDSHPAETD